MPYSDVAFSHSNESLSTIGEESGSDYEANYGTEPFHDAHEDIYHDAAEDHDVDTFHDAPER